MLKVGIIGAGRIGRVHSESISKYVKGAEIKAISDVKITEELTAWAKSMGIPEVYDDYKKSCKIRKLMRYWSALPPTLTLRFRLRQHRLANTFSVKNR